jgi:hypothetical protein
MNVARRCALRHTDLRQRARVARESPLRRTYWGVKRRSLVPQLSLVEALGALHLARVFVKDPLVELRPEVRHGILHAGAPPQVELFAHKLLICFIKARG